MSCVGNSLSSLMTATPEAQESDSPPAKKVRPKNHKASLLLPLIGERERDSHSTTQTHRKVLQDN